jgi:uncharacterized protein
MFHFDLFAFTFSPHVLWRFPMSTPGKQEALQNNIVKLRTAIPELRGVLVASTDGLPMAQSLSGSEDANRIAAMAATALGLGKRIGDSLGTGEIQETTVSGLEGHVFFYAAGPRGVLVVVARGTANVGLVHLEARETAKQIAEILG